MTAQIRRRSRFTAVLMCAACLAAVPAASAAAEAPADSEELRPVREVQRSLVEVAFASNLSLTREGLEVDRWVRRNVVDRFGPVRQVRPELVFEVGCEAVLPSGRHKAGFTLRAPRVLRWRREARPEQAVALAALRALVESSDGAG